MRYSPAANMIAAMGLAALAAAGATITPAPDEREKITLGDERDMLERERAAAMRQAAGPRHAPRELTAHDHERIRLAEAKRARKAERLRSAAPAERSAAPVAVTSLASAEAKPSGLNPSSPQSIQENASG